MIYMYLAHGFGGWKRRKKNLKTSLSKLFLINNILNTNFLHVIICYKQNNWMFTLKTVFSIAGCYNFFLLFFYFIFLLLLL